MKLFENAWELKTGTRLFNPYVPREQAEIVSTLTLDRNKSADRAKLESLIRAFGGFVDFTGREKRRLQQYYNSKFIPLNEPLPADQPDDGSDRWAHLLQIKILDGPRVKSELLYCVFSSNPNFEWSMDPKNKGRNLDKFVRLPISYNEIVRGQTGGAGYYWQPFVSSPNLSKARDRLKPTNISKIISQDITDRIKKDNDRLSAAIQNPERISVGTIRSLIMKSRARREGKNSMRSAFPQLKKQYLSELLNEFISRPNNPELVYPVVIADRANDSSEMIAKTGIENPSSIIVDFMEVIHPIAVVCGNTTGNARNMILEFLGSNSFEELMKTSMISYGAKGNTPLVDSYVYNKSEDGSIRKIHLSSKGGAGAAAKVSSLSVALDEIRSNQTANELYKKEIAENYTDDNLSRAYDFITTITDNQRESQPSYLAAFQLLETFRLGDDSDIEKLQLLIKILKQEYGLSNKFFRDDDEEEELTEQRQSKIIIPTKFLNGDTRTSFNSKIVQAFNEAKPNNNQFTQLVNGIWLKIAEQINSNDAFSKICIWLFNHSATIQVNTYSDQQGDNLILTNITATWPTQLVDSAELLVLDGQRNVNFKLKVNGHTQDLLSTDNSINLSNRSDITKPDWNRPSGISTVKNISRWAGPELKKFTVRKMGSDDLIDIDKNQALQFDWAGSNYTYDEMKKSGVPNEWISEIKKYRTILGNLIKWDNAGLIENPRTKEKLELTSDLIRKTGLVILKNLTDKNNMAAAIEAIVNPVVKQKVRGSDTETATARAAAFENLRQIFKDNPERFQSLLADDLIENVLNEAATDTVYHFMSTMDAVRTLKDEFYSLESSSGIPTEEEMMPKGLKVKPWYLATTRSKIGDYTLRHSGDNSGAVFELDGRWLNRHYTTLPVDYWAGSHRPSDYNIGKDARTREAEDRVFSDQYNIPLRGSTTAIHVFVIPPEKLPSWSDSQRLGYRAAEVRDIIELGKQHNIPVYLYDDKTKWLTQRQRYRIDPNSEYGRTILSGKPLEPREYQRTESDYHANLKFWVELLQKNPGDALSEPANKLRYYLRYYGDMLNQLVNNLHNTARDPTNPEYKYLIPINRFMTKNRLPKAKDLYTYLHNKWRDYNPPRD